MADVKTTFGRRLRLVRKAQRLTLEELGKRASLGYKHIADIERGEKVPSFEAIEKLADALQVQVHELFLPEEQSSIPRMPSLREIAREIERDGSPAIRTAATTLLLQLRDIQHELAP